MSDSKGPYYAEGRYRCEVTDQGIGAAKTGTIQIVFKFRVLEGTQPVCEVENQYERTLYLAVTEKTLEYVVPKLRSMGYDRYGISFIDLNNPRHHDFRGKEFEAYCKHENDLQGEPREKWDVASNGGSKPLDLKAPDSKALRNMDMLFARAAKNMGQSAPASAGPQAVPKQASEDSEVPF